MKSQTAIPCAIPLDDQPTNWPLLVLFPNTHYVRRRRAANSPEYTTKPLPAMPDYGPTRKKQSYLQRGIDKLVAARKQAWLSLKRFGRKVVHSLVKWCVLPLAIATCFSMAEVSPAELPGGLHPHVRDTTLQDTVNSQSG